MNHNDNCHNLMYTLSDNDGIREVIDDIPERQRQESDHNQRLGFIPV